MVSANLIGTTFVRRADRVIRRNWREVLIAMGAWMAENMSYYVITAFILVYITTSLGMAKSVGLNAVLIGSAIHFVTIPLWGALAPLIAVALLKGLHSTVPISLYMAGMCVITVVAVLLARETRGVSLDSPAVVPATREPSDDLSRQASPVTT